MQRFILISTLFFFISFITPSVSAHVSVKPSKVGIATFQTFTIGVPVEQDIPTIGVRLIIPEDVHYVTPNVKPGWNIEIKKVGENEEAKVTELIWTGGEIPAGQRDEFLFSAQSPAQAGTIPWKAYQTYADGTVVAWDTNPKNITAHGEEDEGDEEHDAVHPYSETKVINDLQPTSSPNNTSSSPEKGNPTGTIALIALALATVSLGLHVKRRNK
ncbi:MAG: YcnI family protein [Candidatus Levybacteria bacterium]|nr:YcnI family protein [Candidatus Levybacteria bacterium]